MSADASFAICTPRLRLRQFVDDDVEFLIGLLGDPITMSHWSAPLTAAEATAWLQRALESYTEHGFGRWLVVRRVDDQPIGDVGIARLRILDRLENDLGYIIHRDHWRHGYALEAAAACADWAREHDLGSMVASMAEDNVASSRVAEKLGMALEKRFDNPRNRNKPTRLYRLDFSRDGG
ncbi:MAG: GNAT family N-acetyltransferase [Gammaproteobacteria bacterium]|nr:GNAT family N-acetyltransferase [Gammaproteobacteria bacterium]